MLERIWELLERILRTLGGPYITPPVAIPGLTIAGAYTANDAFGSGFVFEGVPKKGIIHAAFFYDLDNEKKGKDFHIAPSPFTLTANDAAFAPVGRELSNSLVIRITVADYGDGYNANAIGQVSGLGIPYVAPEGKLWCQMITRGADNIAAGSEPSVALAII